MKIIVGVLILLLLLLQYKLWFAEDNILQAYQLKQQLEQQQDANEQLKKKNLALEAEVFDLKQGTDAIEEHARAEMGMIKKDEQFYQIVESKKN